MFIFNFVIISLLCIKTINATTFTKEKIQEFFDHPHLRQIMIDFAEAGFDTITDKEEREIRMLQIMFKNNDYTEASMESGLGSTLITFMKSKNSDVQLEAIKAVRKAAARKKSYAEELVDEGAIPELIKLLHSTNPETVVETLKAIISIINGNYKLRDKFLTRGLAEHFVEFVDPKSSKEILSATVLGILTLTLDTDHPITKATVKTILPVFGDLIRHPDPEIAKDITWALVFLTDGGNRKYEIYLTKEIVDDLFKLLNHKDLNLKGAALGVISNIVRESNDQTQMAFDNGILEYLPELLMHEDDPEKKSPRTIIKDTLVLIPKLFAVTDSPYENVKKIFDTGVIPLVIYHLARGSLEEQEEAAWVLSPASSFGNETHISKMVDLNIVTPMCNLLIKEIQTPSLELVEIIVIAFSEILTKSNADQTEEIYRDLEKCGSVEVFASLSEHGNDMTKELTLKIIKNFSSSGMEAVWKNSAF